MFWDWCISKRGVTQFLKEGNSVHVHVEGFLKFSMRGGDGSSSS